jgi:hypothetical protein
VARTHSSACAITASARSRRGTHLQQEARCGGVNGMPLTAGVHKVLKLLVAQLLVMSHDAPCAQQHA